MKKSLMISVVLVIAFVGCRFPQWLTGDLVINTDSSQAKTLLPAVSMDIADYEVSGDGPSSETFLTNSSTGNTEMANLVAGEWLISVKAMNADGTVIADGSTTTTVPAGGTANAAVTVTPLAGTGALNLTVSWPSGVLASPSVAGTITDPSGLAQDLSFTISGSEATTSVTGLSAGYHTLSVQVLDSGVVAAGGMEVARILADTTTTGTMTFQNVRPADGDVIVDITPDVDEPLTVSITGQVASIDQGTAMSVTASVSPDPGSVGYTWYLDGAKIGTGATISVGSTLDPGTYRLDVSAVSSDGTQGGSTGCTFDVIGTMTAQASLAWDPSPDSTVTGYKLHYGTESGSYTESVDVGNTTSYTLDGLQPNTDYYFAATAYDDQGAESDYSNEISYAPPI
jgi:hypothetical protein